jgi:hypothetical protein
MVEVTVTDNGKSGPGAAASNWPLIFGLVVTVRLASEGVGSSSPPPPQAVNENTVTTINNMLKRLFLISCQAFRLQSK